MLKQYNFRIEDQMIKEAYDIAEVYNTSVSELVREGLTKVIEEKKNDIFYRLTHNVEECNEEESQEIIQELNKLNEDDLKIARTEIVHYARKK